MAPNVLNNLNGYSSNKTDDEKKLKFFKREIKRYQKFIKNNFKYVGENFTYEARSIHYNSKKKIKGIYGKASKEQVKELSEEGIETHMIPWVEDDKN